MQEVTARYARLDRIHIETRSSLQGPSLLSSELVSIIFSHFSGRPDILFGCFSPQDYYRTHHDHYAQVTSNIKNVEDGQCDSQSHYRKGPDYPFNSQEYSMGMSLSHGEITGIVIGCVAFVGILVALVFFVGRNRTYQAWVAFLKSNEIRGAQLPVPQGPVAPKAMDPAAPDFNFAPPQYQSRVFPVQYTPSLVSMTQARTPEIWTWARSHISPLELEGNSNSRAAQSPRELDSNSSAHLLVGNAKHSE